MSVPSFHAALLGAPRAADPGAAALGMSRLGERCALAEDASLVDWTRRLEDDGGVRQLVEAVFANSPFLGGCILAEPAWLRRVLTDGPDAAVGYVVDDLKDRVSRDLDEERLMRELRAAKRRVALAVALADLGGLWLLERVTHALSDFADVALSTAISHLLLREAEKGELVLPDARFPEDGCGYVAVAMGKHGARELNYSSDIDLIVLYDPVVVDYRGRRSPQEAFVRLTQKLISILQTRTADGYVFRVDLNLRPDPRSTPVAIPVAAARTYYATRGQTWERAAMIKARSAAGDVALGETFLAELQPFVWRDHLDFWMIRDIGALKRRLNAERGGGEIGFLGHNVKLGRGGIREIEFFAQTQQLVFGGRDPYVRCIRTVEALTTLAEAGCVDEAVTDELTEAYELLRQLEHRLQMVDDQQTQALPETEDGMRRIAAFMGYDDLEAFRDTVLHHLRCVEQHYAALFDDLGEPAELSADARGWSKLPVARDERARALLAELEPAFARAAAARPQADEALALVDTFLGRLEGGVPTLALLAANPPLVELVLDIVTTAPRIAAELGARPDRLEAAVSPWFLRPVAGKPLLQAECAEALRAGGLEGVATWAHEHRFQIAVHVVRGAMPAAATGQALGDIADAVVEQVRRRAAGAPAVVACGAYGARELTLSSPLSLRFVSDGDGGAARQVLEALARVFEIEAQPVEPGPPSSAPWDVRRRRGGLDDLDALARDLWARTGAPPEASTGEVLSLAARQALLDEEAVKRLLAAHRLLRQVENLLGAALAGHDVESAPAGLHLALARAGDAGSLAQLRDAVEAAAASISSHLLV